MAEMWRCENWEKCTIICPEKVEHQIFPPCNQPCSGGLPGSIEGSVCKPVEQNEKVQRWMMGDEQKLNLEFNPYHRGKHIEDIGCIWLSCKPVEQAFQKADEIAGILPAEAVTVRHIDSLTATLIFDLLEERCPHSLGCAKRFCYLCMRDLKMRFCGG